MELEILHVIQSWHTDWLSDVMIFVSTIGNQGLCWIVLSLVLVLIPRTRKCGLMMMAAMALTYLVGNVFLKNVIARPRPFYVDNSVALLIPSPSEYSFPSGHTMNGFAAATVLFFHYRKAGVAALLLAATIAFSRMYLFVHYPTDIIGGIIVGVADAWLVYTIVRKFGKRELA